MIIGFVASLCLAAIGPETLDEYPEEQTSEHREVAAGPNIETNGHIRASVFVGRDPACRTLQTKSGYGEGALKLKLGFGDLGSAHGDLRMRSDMRAATTGAAVVADLREAYVDVHVKQVDLRLGHQIIAWGRADGFNPTDNLTPQNLAHWTSDWDERRLANLAMRAIAFAGPLSFEGVWVPTFTPSRLPELQLPAPFAWKPPRYPGSRLSNGTLAARVDLETTAFELGVSYVEGFAILPLVGLGEITWEPLSIGIDLTTYRQDVVGLDWAAVVPGGLGFRGELAYRRPRGSSGSTLEVPNADIQYVVGVDRELSHGVSMIAQYIGRYVFGWSRLDASVGQLDDLTDPIPPDAEPEVERVARAALAVTNRAIAGQSHRLSHAWSVHLQWLTFYEQLALDCLALYDSTTTEYSAFIKASYLLGDAFRASVGGQFYGGPDTTLLGRMGQTMSAVFVDMLASF